MANEVRFNIRLNIDGKDKVVTATTAVDNLRHVVDEAKGAASTLQAQLINTNQIVERWNNISGAIDQVSSVLNNATAESRSFGGAMAAANTMAGKNGEDFARLKDQVAELSETIPIARDELANGLYQVISNGVPEDNWIEYLRQSAKASVGGIADLGETVKVTSTLIKNYGLQWSDAGSIQDKIQLTAKNGVTTFEQLAGALPRVASQASTLGVSVDELMATFSTLTGVSGNTAEVSTQLAAVFTALIKPSSEAAEMAQQMGIQFNAASIKAAGGMEQFLQQLDKSVRQYAASSGMLEQEIYGKLFGSAESLRALTPLTNQLADRFRENVADMKNSAGTIDKAFDTMSSTGGATLQMLNNKLGEYSDMLQSTIGNVLPYINMASQMAMGASATVTLFKSLNILGTASKVASMAVAVLSPIVQVCSATMRGASVSATTLRLAIRGLLISTGVGIAVVALTEAINYLLGSSDSAAASVDNLTESEQRAKQAHQQEAGEIANVRSEMMQNIAKLKDFKGSKEQEKTLVQQMNSKYGEAMGYYSTVSQWYQALTANSKTYCDQMINEIRLRSLANQAADLMEQERNIKYDENGRPRRYSKRNKTRTVTHVSGSDPNAPQVTTETIEIQGTSQLDEANRKLTNTHRKLQNVRKEMHQIASSTFKYVHTSGYRPTAPDPVTTGGSGGKRTSPVHVNTTGRAEEKAPLQGSIDWYEKAIDAKRKELQATANTETAKALNTQLEGLQRSLYMLKVKVGIETPPDIEVKKEGKGIIQSIDEQLKDLKLHPIEVKVETQAAEEQLQRLGSVDVTNLQSLVEQFQAIDSISDPTAKGLAIASESCMVLGGALQQLGSDSAAAKAGMVMAAIGQLVLSFAQAMTSASKNWITWLAFGVSGMAQLTSLVGTISKFATGGIVGGDQKSGDNVLVRVNSGEMILNAAQQARLFALANGAQVAQGVSVNTSRLQAIGGEAGAGGELKVDWKLRGRDLVAVIANETRSNRRRSNIRI